MKKLYLFIILPLLLVSCRNEELLKELNDLKNRNSELTQELSTLKDKNRELEEESANHKRTIEKYDFFINQSEQIKRDYRYTGIFRPQNLEVIKDTEQMASRESTLSKTFELKVIKKESDYYYYYRYGTDSSDKKYNLIKKSPRLLDELDDVAEMGFASRTLFFKRTESGYSAYFSDYRMDIDIMALDRQGDASSDAEEAPPEEHYFECRFDLVK